MAKKRIAIIFIVILGIFSNVLFAESRLTYTAYKIKENSVSIDGKLNENFWIQTPDIELRHMADGSVTLYSTKVKIVWDDKFLYLGYIAETPEVYATSKIRDEAFWRTPETFVKLFLDPDADGIDYLEIHINALNNVFCNYMEIPNYNQHRKGSHFEWYCEGIKTAVYVDGTLNNSKDIDRGWSLEVAIPWESIAPFTIGKCPPAPGNKWTVSPQRRYYLTRSKDRKNRKMSKALYVSWPALGTVDSHNLDKYGFLVFSDREPGNLRWKLVWVWTMPQGTDAQIEEAVIKAKSLGFNAIAWNTKNWKAFIHACRKHGIESYAPVSPPGNMEPQQKMKADEYTLPSSRKENPEYQFGGEPINGTLNKEVHSHNPSCFRQGFIFEKFRRQIVEVIKRGYTGIAFDFIGYKNYHGCYCDICNRAIEQIGSVGISSQEATNRFHEESLVRFYEKSNSYAKSYAQKLSRTIKTTCHIYPVFLPNILYGNRCPVDYCGQTVSWFFKPHWDFNKIERYCKSVVENQALYHPNSIGAPFIAFYSKKPYTEDVKSTARVKREIQIVKKAGAQAIQFAELGHILAVPEVAKVIAEELGEQKR